MKWINSRVILWISLQVLDHMTEKMADQPEVDYSDSDPRKPEPKETTRLLGSQNAMEEEEELTGCGATLACDPRRRLHRYLVLILMCLLSFGKLVKLGSTSACVFCSAVSSLILISEMLYAYMEIEVWRLKPPVFNEMISLMCCTCECLETTAAK